MATVETALGPVDADALGVVLSHEHVLVSIGQENKHYPWRFDWEATRAFITRELCEAKAGGIGAMIELSTPDLGRDIAFIQDMARASGVHLIVATGVWRDVPRSFWTRDPDAIADIFVREIEVGIEDSGVKAGAIKVASDMGGVTPEAERVLRAAARACKRTGTPISTHHWAPEQVGTRQVEVLREEGAPMDRVCIGHSADSTDADYLESLLQQGVYLSMDRYPGITPPGAPPRPGWEERNATVVELVRRGWASKIMLGHDGAPMPVVKGTPAPDIRPTRYLFVTTVAVPAMRAAGVSDEDVDLMLRVVPRRFLTGES